MHPSRLSANLLLRAAFVALGVAFFVAIFRPFDLTLSSRYGWLVIGGLAPLNFCLSLFLHAVPLRVRPPIKATLTLAAFVSANVLYLSTLLGGDWRTLTIQVGIIAGLTVITTTGILTLQRYRSEVLELRAQDQPAVTLTFVASVGAEHLSVTSTELLYLKAEGNYVEIAFKAVRTTERRLLRGTLKGMLSQSVCPGLIQTHRSFAANIPNAKHISGTSHGLTIDFGEGATVPVSRAYVDKVRDTVASPDSTD